MDVPLFPMPPARGGVATPLSDVPDVATLPRAPVSVVSHVRIRDAALEREPTYKRSPCTRKRRRARKNSIHPRVAFVKDAARRRVTKFCMRMSERRAKYDEGNDDDDVVCGIRAPTTISEELVPRLKNGIIRNKWTKSVAVQTIVGLPLRLRVLPSLRDIEEDNENTSNSRASRFLKYLRFLGRLSFSQFGLLWLLVIWIVAGAAAFCATEGPREREQVILLKNMQKDLAVGLATELRQLRTEQNQDVEPLWSDKVRQYVAKHEELLLVAVASGYGESGNSGELWTFPGCVLFAISLITTLGFGAPVPRTTAGRTVGIIFAVIGIPAHFILILNFGLMATLRLQRYANTRRNLQFNNTEPNYSIPMPRWVKIMPLVCLGIFGINFLASDVISQKFRGVQPGALNNEDLNKRNNQDKNKISISIIAVYYILGILCFGIARSRPIAASILFPLDFTAAGGLSTIVGYVRILYGLYLEGAVTIIAIIVAVLQVSATQSLTNVGLKYGLLIEA